MEGFVLNDKDKLIDAICCCINDRYDCNDCPYFGCTKPEIPSLGITKNTKKLSERKECVEMLLWDLKAYILEAPDFPPGNCIDCIHHEKHGKELYYGLNCACLTCIRRCKDNFIAAGASTHENHKKPYN